MEILKVDTPPPALRQVTLVMDEEEAAFLTDLLGKTNGTIAYSIYEPLVDLDNEHSLRRRFSLDSLPVINVNSLENA